ncbi:MAG TPA: RIP metalloprotease RseP [Gammaproteobacteria bacterium]|nr:RIP metalloprotease RseP [Gammaproteobacteria bacterium]
MQVITSVVAFIVVIGILVTVHEFGHFWVARRVGVQVLRFSVGFGRPLWRRVARDGTEYAISAIPLGGYVKMLDEREGEVPADQLEGAFNRKPLWKRNAVVVAGPLFNFLFAILAFWAILLIGETAVKPMVGAVTPNTPAATAGFRQGDEIVSVGGESVKTWDDALVALLGKGTGESDLPVTVRTRGGDTVTRHLDVASIGPLGQDPDLLKALGVRPLMPPSPPLIDSVSDGSAADRAGLKAGDRIYSVAGESTGDWVDLVHALRAHAGKTVSVEVGDGDARRTVSVSLPDDGILGVRRPPLSDPVYRDYVRTISYGPVAASWHAVRKTWDRTALTVKMMWKMVVGQASVKNLSGPINIAQYAGDSASLGLTPFLSFLALVSISLGVINLMPVPVLDGGHLLFNVIEWVRGGVPLSERAQGVGVQIGIALVMMLMAVAFYNDLVRIAGPG